MDQPIPADPDAELRAASASYSSAHAQAAEGISLTALRALSEDELVRRYDALTMPPDAEVAWPRIEANDYLNELDRRDAAAQGDRIERLTRTVTRLTWVIAILTAISTLAVMASVF